MRRSRSPSFNELVGELLCSASRSPSPHQAPPPVRRLVALGGAEAAVAQAALPRPVPRFDTGDERFDALVNGDQAPLPMVRIAALGVPEAAVALAAQQESADRTALRMAVAAAQQLQGQVQVLAQNRAQDQAYVVRLQGEIDRLNRLINANIGDAMLWQAQRARNTRAMRRARRLARG